MPITKSAIKKVRSDKRKAKVNRLVKSKMKTALKDARLNPSKETINKVYSALDRAVKARIMKKNTVARLKSRLIKKLKSDEKENVFDTKKVKAKKNS